MADVLVIIAHPDDEIFVSGVICLCVEKGFKIALICVTDGEGGSRELLRAESKLQLGEVRRRELELSAWVLGIDQVMFLAQADIAQPKTGAYAWSESKLIADIATIIQGHSPQLILTHGPFGGYGNQAHCVVFSCVMSAVQKAGFQGSVFSFCGQMRRAFFSWHFDQPSTVLVDVRQFRRRREAALDYHQSQNSFFLQPAFPKTVRKYLSAIFGYVFRPIEAGRRRIPIGTSARFFKRYPVEGLVLQKSPDYHRSHFFLEHYSDDERVQIIQ